jgi:cell division protein FtsB
MFELNKKKQYRKFIYSPVILLLLLFILFLVLKALWGVYAKEEISSDYLKSEQGELDKMVARQKELAQSVEFLKTDRGVEAEIRSKFRVIKEGESVAVILDNDATSTPKVATTTPPSIWKRFLSLLGL